MASQVQKWVLSIVQATVGLTTVVAVAQADEGPWSQFRGPNATGIVSAAEIPTQITPNDYLWQIDLPGVGHSSPVYWKEKLYLTCETAGQEKRQVLCLDCQNGDQVWAYEEAFLVDRSYHQFNSYAASTPTADENGVYVSWINGQNFVLFALGHDGRRLWRREIPCGFASKFGPGASPIVLDGTVIMGNDHAGSKCFLIAVDAKTGETTWVVPRKTGLASYCTPKVYRPSNGPAQLIFASAGHGVTSVDPKSGKVYWEVPCDFAYKTCATPVIADGIVFVTAGRGSAGVETVAVRLPDVTTAEEPEVVYRSNARLPYVPTPLAYDGKFLLWNDAGTVTCIKAVSGEELWQGRVPGKYFASPLLIDNRIYNATLGGELIVIAADRFEILAETELPEGTHATPAVVGDRLYLRTYGKLICVGK
jgi:outer membrane protein assembly factor BamB